MAKKPQYGLLIDYEYCTGCYACRVACCQEYGHEAGSSGMQVIEQVQPLPKGKAYLCFLPFPTELCVLSQLPRERWLFHFKAHCMCTCSNSWCNNLDVKPVLFLQMDPNTENSPDLK